MPKEGGKMSVVLAVSLCALFLASSLKATAASTKIIIGHAAVNSRVVPLWIAQEQRFFAKNGLDAEVVFIRNGPILISALTAGRIAVGYAAGEALVLASAASGADVKLVAAFTSRFNHDVVVRPGITKPQDLRGKRFGVQSIGGGMWMRAMLALEHLGLEPERDGIQLLVVGDQTILLQALDTGTIDVATLDKVFTSILKQKGFPILLDLYHAHIPMIGMSVMAQKSTIEKRPEIVENALKAMLEGLAFSLSLENKPVVIRTIMKRLKITDPAAAELAYLDIVNIMDRKPFPSVDGLRNVHRLFSSRDPRIANVKPEEVIDNRILNRLDKVGFLDEIYKNYGVK
jgi:ABC-type nitrate/sulfonate/bicarbonate transport system substrate-binding protein